MTSVLKRTPEWWDKYFLGLAKYYASASKDPSTKVGCVITDGGKEVLSLGYNGLRADVEDTEEGLNNREFKLLNMVHAEINALERIPEWLKEGHMNGTTDGVRFFERASLHPTLYVYPFLSCSSCAYSIGARGVVDKVVSTDYIPERWKADIEKGLQEFKYKGITVQRYPMDEIT